MGCDYMAEKMFGEVYVNYVKGIDELYEKGFSTSISKLKNEEVVEVTVRLNHLQLPKKYIKFSSETSNYIVIRWIYLHGRCGQNGSASI